MTNYFIKIILSKIAMIINISDALHDLHNLINVNFHNLNNENNFNEKLKNNYLHN